MRLCAGKDQNAIAHLAKKNRWMTYDRILEDANRSFSSLSDTNKWGPDIKNKDKQSAPESYLTESEANAMVQKAINKAKEDFHGNGGLGNGGQDKGIECFKCGKKGHLWADCKSGRQTAAWKTKPPASGQPESKHINRKEWHWSAKCSTGESPMELRITRPKKETKETQKPAPRQRMNLLLAKDARLRMRSTADFTMHGRAVDSLAVQRMTGRRIFPITWV
jgi:hypothetical protein